MVSAATYPPLPHPSPEDSMVENAISGTSQVGKDPPANAGG